MSRLALTLLVVPFLLGVPGMAYADEEPGIGQCVRECAWENRYHYPTKKEAFKECKRLCREDEPVITFEKTYGGTHIDWGYAGRQTSDGGFIVTGFSFSFTDIYHDVYLVRADANGNEMWSRTFGGRYTEEGRAVQETSDGGFIIVGDTSSFGAGFDDVYLIKTDENGNEVWSKTFGGISSDEGWSVQETSDGGFIIAGYTISFGLWSSDVYLVRTDADGNAVWTKHYGGNAVDFGRSVQETADGGFIVAGYTNSYGSGGWDIALMKTDANGNMVWSNTYGGGADDYGYAVQETEDGGFIVAGATSSALGAGMDDICLVRTDASGKAIWFKTYGGGGSDEGWSVQETENGGFIVAGATSSFGAGKDDVALLRTDADGNIVWIKTFGGISSDNAYSVQETTDGGFVAAGFTHSFGAGSWDVYLVKTDAEGNVQ